MRTALAALLAFAAASPVAAAGLELFPSGSVMVRAGDSGEWGAVSAARSLAPGDQIRTEAASTAEIRLEDGSRVVLGPNSQFVVDSANSRESLFTLAAGKLKAVVAGYTSARTKIRTKSAVMSVRGTVFDVSADGDDTEVTMAEGVLEIKDSKGKQAVLTSEETVKIGEGGMEAPHFVGLSDSRALDAVRPLTVRQEIGRDSTRAMLEELRNRELKANEAQLGKDVVDAFGRRVRLEEYLLRPDSNSFKLLFLSLREDRFDWGHLIERFKNPISDDLSAIGNVVDATFQTSPTMPGNWLTYMEFFATNKVDSIREVIQVGDPVAIDFAGYGAGTLFYPQTIDFTQTLSGPGVPGGERVQFAQAQDFGNTNLNMFTVTQNVIDSNGALSPLVEVTLDPANAFDVNQGYTSFTDNSGNPNFALFATREAFPRGESKADYFEATRYGDGSTVGVEKILVSNDGKVLGLANADEDDFTKEGSFNLQVVIGSNLFQGRTIDVMIAPEILSQKKTATATAFELQP